MAGPPLQRVLLPADRTSVPAEQRPDRAARRLAHAAIVATAVSVATVVAVGALGPSAAVPAFGAASPWPPWFAPADPPAVLVSVALWAAVLLGGAGLGMGLLAARHGWQPRPGRLVAGSLIAVVALLVVPPVGSTDMMDYAVYGRIAALGGSPYRMTPLELRATGDPVGALAPTPWDNRPSVYGPLATATEWAAASLGAGSAGRTVFWLKVWNALAYLATTLALDRLTRSDRARRIRAHLLWSVNPLMLLAVLAGGHIDGLSAALAVLAVASLSPRGRWCPSPRRAVLAGLLLGAAVAVKAPLLLVGAGLAWAMRRSPRALAALVAGMLAVLVPGYLVAGWAAVSALAGRAAGSSSVYDPWLLTRGLGLHLSTGSIDILGACGSLTLAVIMLWRLPAGLASYPFARPALALLLGWLIATPQQRPWYDAAVFPLLVVMPATRLDWVAVARAVTAALAQLPGVTYYPSLVPGWLSASARTISVTAVPIALVGIAIALCWLCASGRWESRQAARDGPRLLAAPPAGMPPASPG